MTTIIPINNVDQINKFNFYNYLEYNKKNTKINKLYNYFVYQNTIYPPRKPNSIIIFDQNSILSLYNKNEGNFYNLYEIVSRDVQPLSSYIKNKTFLKKVTKYNNNVKSDIVKVDYLAIKPMISKWIDNVLLFLPPTENQLYKYYNDMKTKINSNKFEYFYWQYNYPIR